MAEINTGIIRRIDDLGRVVIPKEIRSNLNINAGDAMLLSTNGDQVIFQKYYPEPALKDRLDSALNTLERSSDLIDAESYQKMLSYLSEAKKLLNNRKDDEDD